MPRREIRKEQVVMQYLLTFGHVSEACNKAGISRKTFYKWLETDAIFKEHIADADEAFLDLVENKIKTKIQTGDWTAIRYYLETHGKSRGYGVEKQQVEHSGGMKLDIVRTTITPQDQDAHNDNT